MLVFSCETYIVKPYGGVYMQMHFFYIFKWDGVTYSPLTYKQHIRYSRNIDIDGGKSVMITEKVGNRIKFLRQQQGLTQEKLALKAGIDRTYLAGIESGKRNATLVSIEKIVNALEVTLSFFFEL